MKKGMTLRDIYQSFAGARDRAGMGAGKVLLHVGGTIPDVLRLRLGLADVGSPKMDGYEICVVEDAIAAEAIKATYPHEGVKYLIEKLDDARKRVDD